MVFSRLRTFFVVIIVLEVLTIGVFLTLNNGIFVKQAVVSNIPSNPPNGSQKLSNPPEIVKAVYVTGYSAGSKKYLNYLENIFKTTEINAVVVDVKDYSGTIPYKAGKISDIDALIKFFHEKNIYVIGRIVVFEDPVFAKARPELAIYDKTATTNLAQPILWKDNNNLFWLDPASKDVWDYNLSFAKDAFYHGFDEINFDYIRFPSDGKTENMGFPVWDGKTSRAKIINEFFQYLRVKLPNEKISIDLFGQTTTSKDDMGIGQIIENAFENFDYVCPMLYPSHYANGFIGFSNPVEHPYEVVKYSMDSAFSRKLANQVFTAKIRPWLQDFNRGVDYTPQMVEDEIRAVEDSLGSKYNGFMLWNPSNIYTTEAVFK